MHRTKYLLIGIRNVIKKEKKPLNPAAGEQMPTKITLMLHR